MAFNYNHVTLVGRICTDPIYKEISPRLQKLSFIIAINKFYKVNKTESKEKTDFVPITLYGPKAETGQKILVKGQPLLVWGKLSVRNYMKEDESVWYTEVSATNFQVLEKLSNRIQQAYTAEPEAIDEEQDLLEDGQELIEKLNETKKQSKEKR